jgi:hypothetical protein
VTNGEFVVQQCPFCHLGTIEPSNQWKLYIRSQDGVFFCHRCQRKGAWSQFVGFLDANWRKLWDKSVEIGRQDSCPANLYLKDRGISGPESTILRFHPYCPYFDTENGKQASYHPAIIAAVAESSGQMMGIQRIYLSPDGRKADLQDPKKCLGAVKGGAIRLGQLSADIAITEGIETGLAVMLGTGMPVWAAISANGMESIHFPIEVKRVFIWADLDKSSRGTRAAEKLAQRLLGENKVPYILLPAGPIPNGQKSLDWLDIFNKSPSILVEAMKAAKPFTQAGNIEPSPLIDDAKWPDQIAPEAFYGLAGDIVRTIEPHTEADPTALLIQFLVAFGNAIGRNAHYLVESTQHHLNLFSVLVGDTAKGRKGTSLDHILALMKRTRPDWYHNNVISGLSTGEGLIHHVRNPVEKQKSLKNNETGDTETITETKDEGVRDKRLLVIEPEYSAVLRTTSRDGNTLSATVREAWDRGNLQTLTKNSPEKATGAHISIVGHITVHELRRYLTETEALNGYGNRFLWLCVRRSKLLPFGGQLKTADLDACCARLERAINFGTTLGEIKFADSARSIWIQVYHKLSEAKPGLFGSMTARGEAQVIRLSCVYAVLDESSTIQPQHLMAGLALWEYCEDSCRYIFGRSLGDLVADRILDALRTTPHGLTRTDIRELFHGKQSAARTEQALGLLVQFGLARSEKESTSGRSIERWLAMKAPPAGSAIRAERVESPLKVETPGPLAPLKPLTRPPGADQGEEING